MFARENVLRKGDTPLLTGIPYCGMSPIWKGDTPLHAGIPYCGMSPYGFG